jgi:hypothetical protein
LETLGWLAHHQRHAEALAHDLMALIDELVRESDDAGART